MINEAIKSALKITIPSLNPDGSAGPFAALTSNTTTTITTSRKSPPTTNGSSPKEATTSNNNNNNKQPPFHDQMSPLRPKQTSPITNPSGYQSSPITNVLSHLHAAKKEAMLKTNAISPVASRSQTAPNSNNNKMLPPHSRKSSAGPAPSMGVISEFDKTKYTLGKWVDTIIVQMNDPSIDDIELDDSIKKSNFNSMAVAKEKEAAQAAGNANNNAAPSTVPANATSSSSSNLSANSSNISNGQQLSHQHQQQTNKEFEYVEGDVDDDNDEDGNSDKDEGKYIKLYLKKRNPK